MHGSYEANMAMHDCDVMVCIGARFDDRITGRLNAFSPNSKKIHIDIDPSSINKNVRVDVGDRRRCRLRSRGHGPPVAGAAARSRTRAASTTGGPDIARWRARNSFAYKPSNDVIMPQYALERLYELTKDRDTYITTEVGQHQMWAAQFFGFEQPNRWMTSGGLGTMGYGLPAALGVQIAHPDSLVIDIAGDASIQMCIQEMSLRGAVQCADQDLHPEQPVHGHGAPVAAAAARQPPVELLYRSDARLRQAGRGLWRPSASAAKSRAISMPRSRR